MADKLLISEPKIRVLPDGHAADRGIWLTVSEVEQLIKQLQEAVDAAHS